MMYKGKMRTHIASKSERGRLWMIVHFLDCKEDYAGAFKNISNDVYDDMKQTLIAQDLDVWEK
jgi:hypothetical protein